MYKHWKRLADNGKSASEMKTLKTERVEGVGREAFAAEDHTLRTMTGEGATDVRDWVEVEGRRCRMGMGHRWFPCSTNGDTLGTGRQRTSVVKN